MKRIQIFGIGALLLLTGAGCIYSRTGSYQTSITSDPTQVFPSAKWEPHDNAWRQEFSFRTYYQRSGVYDAPFTASISRDSRRVARAPSGWCSKPTCRQARRSQSDVMRTSQKAEWPKDWKSV